MFNEKVHMTFSMGSLLRSKQLINPLKILKPSLNKEFISVIRILLKVLHDYRQTLYLSPTCIIKKILHLILRGFMNFKMYFCLRLFI